MDHHNIDGATPLAQTLIYGSLGWRVFPVRADKTPLVKWKEGASSDPAEIAKMCAPHPLADPARALDAATVVVDVDRQPGRNGFEQFRALAGVPVDDVPTLQATTPSGGRHLYFATLGRRYNNNRVPGTTAIDLKTIGGYVVLPAPGNGRKWLAPLDTPLLSAFACFDSALKKEHLVVAPPSALIPWSPDDPWACRQALIALGRACAKIVAAPCGARENTRHQQCFYIGGLIGRGDLDYATAYDALLAASRAVAHVPPWRNLEDRVAASIAAGMDYPLALSNVELFMRNLRARMRAQRPAP